MAEKKGETRTKTGGQRRRGWREREGGGERDRAKQKLYIETTKTREKKEDMFRSVRR